VEKKMWDWYLKFPCHIYLDLKWSVCSRKLTRNSQSRDSHTFMAPKFFSSTQEHHAKIQFQICSLARQVELAIVFFGLPNVIDNPSPLIVIEANFFISKGKYMHYNPFIGRTHVFDAFIWVARLVAL